MIGEVEVGQDAWSGTRAASRCARSRAPQEETGLTGRAYGPVVEEPVAVPPKEVGAADLAGREQEERRAEKNRWRHAGRCGRRGERRGARGQGWAVQRERERGARLGKL
jgi:hypothetical protein